MLINKMHLKLNSMIESSNYNLLNNEVQQYSRRLDRAIVRYNRITDKENIYDTIIL
ncbi:MAG: Spo0E family sporulation regulatory protein-aspartic acid phosphatase [Clostridia bacterium]|nr:Spo0E family sporulation regulatory protein-aspartic acid phosphatase [Clostridia bacterium]